VLEASQWKPVAEVAREHLLMPVIGEVFDAEAPFTPRGSVASKPGRVAEGAALRGQDVE
jgi:hypothetical protein